MKKLYIYLSIKINYKLKLKYITMRYPDFLIKFKKLLFLFWLIN